MSAVPATEKARATRAALIQSAAAMFEHAGYGAVALRDVARANDLTTGAIYGHFRNKADLLAAAIADRIETELVAPTRGSGATLTEVLATQAHDYRARAGMRALMVEGAHAAHVDEDAGDTIRGVLDERLSEWREQYRSVQAAGAFREVDMDALLVLLLAVELGLGVLEAIDVDLPEPSAWSSIVRHILEAIEER